MNEIQQPAQAAPSAGSQGISKEEAVKKLLEAQNRRESQAQGIPKDSSELAGLNLNNASEAGGAKPAPSAPAQAASTEDKEAVKKVEQAAASGNEDSFARQFAALTREQRSLFAQREAMKKDMEQIDQFKKRQELKKTDLTKYLEEEGLDPDSVMKAYLNKGEPPQPEDRISVLEKKIADYEAQIKQQELDARQKAEQQKEQAAVDTFKKQMNDFINSKPDQYEAIIAGEGFDLVFEKINKHFEQTGEILEFAQAADEIENNLFEKAKKFSSLKKLSSHLAQKMPQQDSPKQNLNEQKTDDGLPSSFSQTLTSDFVPVSGSSVLQTLDAETLKQRAIEKLKAKQRQAMG